MKISFEGRLNRWKFFKLSVLQTIQLMIPFGAIVLLGSLIEKGSINDLFSFSIFLFVPVIIILVIYGISFKIKRFHDLNKSGWYYLLTLIPLINLYFGFYLLYFKKGTDGQNRFGEDPLLNN